MAEGIPVTAAPMTDGDISARWRTCLHEAGHAVAGRMALKRDVRAVVYDNNVGATYLDIEGGIPRTLVEALSIAAGTAAETLADKHPPPQAPLPPALAAAYPELAEPLMAQMQESLPDAVAIARWCTTGIEKEPERWANRFHWLHREARIFVARHQHRIVEAARGLFAQGILTLRTEPHSKPLAAAPAG